MVVGSTMGKVSQAVGSGGSETAQEGSEDTRRGREGTVLETVVSGVSETGQGGAEAVCEGREGMVLDTVGSVSGSMSGGSETMRRLSGEIKSLLPSSLAELHAEARTLVSLSLTPPLPSSFCNAHTLTHLHTHAHTLAHAIAHAYAHTPARVRNLSLAHIHTLEATLQI